MIDSELLSNWFSPSRNEQSSRYRVPTTDGVPLVDFMPTAISAPKKDLAFSSTPSGIDAPFFDCAEFILAKSISIINDLNEPVLTEEIDKPQKERERYVPLTQIESDWI